MEQNNLSETVTITKSQYDYLIAERTRVYVLEELCHNRTSLPTDLVLQVLGVYDPLEKERSNEVKAWKPNVLKEGDR